MYDAKVQKKYQQSKKGKKAKKRATIRYRKSEKGKIYSRIASKINYYSHPKQIKARRLIRYLIDNNYIEYDMCAICGNTNTECHHPNYDMPNNIYWLCKKHHLDQH